MVFWSWAEGNFRKQIAAVNIPPRSFPLGEHWDVSVLHFPVSHCPVSSFFFFYLSRFLVKGSSGRICGNLSLFQIFFFLCHRQGKSVLVLAPTCGPFLQPAFFPLSGLAFPVYTSETLYRIPLRFRPPFEATTLPLFLSYWGNCARQTFAVHPPVSLLFVSPVESGLRFPSYLDYSLQAYGLLFLVFWRGRSLTTYGVILVPVASLFASLSDFTDGTVFC